MYSATVGSFISALSHIVRCYTPSDTILVSNNLEVADDTQTWVKLKEIKLESMCYPESRFRFAFDQHRTSGGTNVYARIYKNGVAIGSQQTAPDAWITRTEDIDIGNWLQEDTIELWGTSGTTAGKFIYLRNFRICGAGSEFINTLGM